MHITIPEGKKIYFLSDFHLGLPMDDGNHTREKAIVHFLNTIAQDAYKIYFVGDIFDTWFEYKTTIPKGYARFFGTLAALQDKGILMDYFIGNHDMWMNDYFHQEFGMTIYKNHTIHTINGKKILIGHGDGLGPGDKKYKLLKSVLRNPLATWLYRWIHPDIGLSLAQYFSRKGSKHHMEPSTYLGDDKEWLVQYAIKKAKEDSIDYFIFGHRHLPLSIPIGNHSTYINLGDWIQYYSYAIMERDNISLQYYSLPK